MIYSKFNPKLTLGDKFNATLCAIGHNLRLITRKSSLIPT